MREKISVCITTGNEEKNIRRCLESVRWADEIVVVDSFSTDRTVEICRAYTELVFRHRWLGYIGQKNLIKDLASHPWVFFVDADEEVSPMLRDEILKEFESGASVPYAGYVVPRMVHFFGRWIRHGDWYPDTKLRLFRRNKGRCAGREPHDRTVVEGPVKRLRGPLYHYTYANLFEQAARANEFSTIMAEGWMRDGRRFRIRDLVFRPPYRFLHGYVIKRGFLDGIPGLIIAGMMAYGVFLKYAKLWETRGSGQDVPPHR